MNASTKFAEFLSREPNGDMRMRLGHTVYFQKGFKFYTEVNGELIRIPLETLVAKPWIQRNFEAEKAFQRRKALAISLQDNRKHWRSRHECEQYKVRKSNTDVLGNPIN